MESKRDRKLRRKIAAKYEPERRAMTANFVRVDGLFREVDAMLGKGAA